MRSIFIVPLALILFISAGYSLADENVVDLSSSSSSSEEDHATRPSDYISRGSFSLCKLRNFRISKAAERLSGQELVDYVNTHQNLWKSELNTKFASLGKNVITGMMGVKYVGHSIQAKKMLGKSRHLEIDLPKAFDSRENWPNCASVRAIRDQSSCGSCWAFGAVEAMSDRICIASGGQIQVSLSADDLLSCCKSCGFGCEGGEPLEAWKYWVDQGIVTGSNYTTHQGCRPYPFPPCEHHSTKQHFQPCKHDLYPTPKCEKKCDKSYTDLTGKLYAQDKYFGRSFYAVANSEKALMTELYTNGPFEIAFEVYEDFLNYKSGIYIHQAGKMAGGHAVKLIGWGEEGGVPYWIVANSWNTDFGEDGFFRIVRGRDECGIESGGVAGLPKLNRVGGVEDVPNAAPSLSTGRVLLHERHRHGKRPIVDEFLNNGDIF